MANKITYELVQIPPKAGIGYSGNLSDPAELRINKALGRYGTVPPYLPGDREKPDRKSPANAVVVDSQLKMVLTDADGGRYQLPLEPLVTVSGRNTIARRRTAKAGGQGTVKECWMRDDYEIIIRGRIVSGNEAAYPAGEVNKLMDFFAGRRSAGVEQDVLNKLGINFLAIESVSLPHTSGMNCQQYEIKAYSDAPVELLVK